MSDLHQLAPNVYFFPAPVNTLILTDTGGGALLVDAGLDDAQARKVLRALAQANLTPTAILNTHSHPDHHGANAFILKKFPHLPIYAPEYEAAVINHPIIMPLSEYGALMPAPWQNKFVLAPASPAQPLQAGVQTVAGHTLELISVPGHAVNMYAVRVGDVLYAADALFGETALQKHPLVFCVDSAAQKASARQLAALSGLRVTLPAHGEPVTDLPALAAANLAAFARVTEAVRDAAATPATIDELLARVATSFGLSMSAPAPLLLNRVVVSAHLAELLILGQLEARVEENRLLFEAVTNCG